MKTLMLAILLAPALSLAADEKASAPSTDPMSAWVPRTVANEARDRREIMALFHAMEDAGRKGDLDAAVRYVDFPVTMITDDSRGQAIGEVWTRERWTEVMRPFYDQPMKDMKITHKPTIFLLSDSLASVDDVVTMTMGGKTVTSRSSTLLIRRDGEWRVKMMAEGGWGDMMAASQSTAGGGAPGSEGTGSAASGPGAQGTGGGADAAGSHGTGVQRPPAERPGSGVSGGPREPAERTTK